MRWRLRGMRGPGDGGSAELDARLSETWEAAAAAVGRMLDLPAGKEALLASSGLLHEGTLDLPAFARMTRRVARRRRRLVLGSAAGLAAVLTAGAVALAVTGVPDAGRDDTGRPVVNTAYVVKRVDSALGAAEPAAIAQMTVTTSGVATPGGATTTEAEEWSQGGQWRAVAKSPAGHPVYDEGFSTSSVYTLVSYLTRTWARKPRPGRPAASASGPRSCVPAPAARRLLFRPVLGTGSSASSLPTVARALRAAISCGTMAVTGRQRVDGIEAIELTSRQNSLISETMWVSPGTYLPVRVTLRSASGKAVLLQTADITWLPPTAQNLARLTVPIPAGFRRVPFAEAARMLQQIPGVPLPKSR